MSLALKEISLPPDELRLHRQLLTGQAQRLLRERLRHARELEHHAARLDHDDPTLGRALPLAHPGLGGLLRERLVGEDVDPDLAAALDLARHRDPGGLDLAVRDPAVLQRLDPELAELDRALALRLAAAATPVVLAEGGLLREQHQEPSPPEPPCSSFVPELSSFDGSSCIVFGVVVSGASATGFGVSSTCGSIVGCSRPSAERALDVVLAARAISLPGTSALAAGPPASTAGRAQPVASAAGAAARRPLPAAAGRARTAASTAWAAACPGGAGSAALAGPAAANGAEPLAILLPAAAALARSAEALRAAAAAARRVLVAQARLLAAARDPAVAFGHDLALVDPALDADPASRRASLDKAVVDVRADRVQRHAALRVLLRAAHLRAAEPSGALHFHACRTRADRGGERALHRAPERHTVLKLLGDRLRDELRVELRALDLIDVDVDVLLRHRVHLAAQRVHLDTRFADHDPGARGVDVDRDPLLVLADQDVGQAGVRKLLEDVLANLDVFDEGACEFLLADHPVRLPVVDDADAQAARVNLLAHQAVASFFLRRALERRRFDVVSPVAEPAPPSASSLT